MRAPRLPASRRHASAVLASALLASGCGQLADTFFVTDMETEETCKTWPSVSFPGTPAGTSELEQSFVFPLGEVGGELPEGRLETALRLRLFELTAGQSGADLSGMEYASVSLRRLGSREVIRTLVETYQPGTVAAPSRLTLRGVEPVSVPQLARDDTVELVFRVRGVLPAEPWTAELKACVGLWARVHYFEFVY